MNQEVAIAEPKELSETQMTDITSYLKGLGSNLTPVQTAQFVGLCREFQLNPFKREIYGIAYGKKFNIIVGYEVYIKRAEGTGRLDGWERGTSGAGADMKAWIKIYRKDWKMPFYHEVDYSEYVQRNYEGKVNAMWATKPKTMLMKVVTAQAFRLAFPADFAGMPYTSDELPTGGDTSGDVKPEPKVEIAGVKVNSDFAPQPHSTHNDTPMGNEQEPMTTSLDPSSSAEVTHSKAEHINTETGEVTKVNPVDQANAFIEQNGGDTGGVKMAPESVAGQVDPADAKRANFWRMMCEMYGPEAPLKLQELTAFNDFKGHSDVNRVTAKQLNYKFRTIEAEYKKWKESGGVPLNVEQPPAHHDNPVQEEEPPFNEEDSPF